MNDLNEYLDRLNLEDWIFIIFIVLAVMNIYANNLLKKHAKTNINKYKQNADQIFLIVIVVSTILYIYFFKRNYNAYKTTNDNKIIIKILGSLLILIGSICLLIFQLIDSNNSLTPSI